MYPRRPILVAVLAAIVTTGIALAVSRLGVDSGLQGRPAPEIAGTTLDGTTISLADLRGHPVVVNFWGPSCEPCREEFPLFLDKLREHAGDGLVILGVLNKDPPEPARAFVAEFGATWPTVEDPDERFARAYRVVARPQTYFVDRDGILRSVQIGWVREEAFDRQYAMIAPG
jgi:cytochrome c biogenesis protein CcmG/thiol:disulfide interchange protein DsbE